MIDISVIIVNYQALGLVRECIKGLKRLSSRCAIEILVVDNSNDFRLATLLQERYGDVVYVPMQKNIGFGAANNVGIKKARGKYILILNYDITPLPVSLDTLFDYMESHPEVGIAAPRLLNPDGSIQHSYYRFHSLFTPLYRRSFLGRFSFARRNLEHFFMKNVTVTAPIDVDWLLGACLFVRASCIQTVGLMDERFFLYFEDTDWCRRFSAFGYHVRYVPTSRMIHLHKRDSAHGNILASLFHRTTRIHITSWIRYLYKWKGK